MKNPAGGGKVTSPSEIIIGYCVHLADSELDTTYSRAGTILDQLSVDYRIWRSMLDRRDLRTLYTSLFQEPLWCETHWADAIESSNSNGSLLSDWVDLPWIYRFFHRLFCRKRGNSFQMFELPAETVNVPTVRSLVSSQQATWGKKDTFFLFATRGTAPTQHCVSLFSCKRARGILELSPCWKRVGVHHFV